MALLLTEENLMADHELDLRGLNCPIPVMRMKKQLQSMSSGQTLRVLATDPGSIPDFKAYVKSSGDTLLESKKTPEGDFEFLLKRV
jgi:tRNA 2-thiouridine synthesizing protein A